MDELYEEVPALHIVIRKVLQDVQHAQEKLLLSSKMRTAEERYVELLKNDGQLVQLVRVKDMASYLGISPESLSRIRKNIIKTA